MENGSSNAPGHSPETPLRGNVFAATCPTRQLLDRLADKWTVLILFTLNSGPQRFGALKRRIGGISQKMLSQSLKTLERDGLITRAVEHTIPVAVTYSITPLGRSLTEPLTTMIDWAETRMGEVMTARDAFDSAPAPS